MDVALGRMLAEVESHFCALRGQGLVLSERDVSLVEAWHAAGYSAPRVCQALTEAMAEGRDRRGAKALPGSLAYFRRSVEARLRREAGKVAEGAVAPADSAPESNVDERLDALPESERERILASVEAWIDRERHQLGRAGLELRRQALLEDALDGRLPPLPARGR